MRGIDGGGAHHVRIISGCAEREADPGSKKPDEKHSGQYGNAACENQRVPAAAEAERLKESKNRALLQNVGVGCPAHRHQVDRIKAGVGYDSRKNRRDAQLGLENRRYTASGSAGQHGSEKPKERVAGSRNRNRNGHAKNKSAVRRQISDIQDAKAEKQRHGNQGIHHAQFQSRLQNKSHSEPPIHEARLSRA